LKTQIFRAVLRGKSLLDPPQDNVANTKEDSENMRLTYVYFNQLSDSAAINKRSEDWVEGSNY